MRAGTSATTRKRILVAVTGHGFGHATRSAEVVRELLSLAHAAEVTVSTTAPRRLFETRGGDPRIDLRAQAYEPGTIQKSCFEVDLSGTRAAYRRYLAEREERLDAEVDFLRSGGFCGVLADVPAIPLAAAARCAIPSAALWNFTWDWILEPILAQEARRDRALARLPAILRDDYSCAGLHLRLPFSPRETTFSNVEDVPLVGRQSAASREGTLGELGLDPRDSRPIVLVAMGGWECCRWAPIEVRGCEGLRLLVVGDVPLESRAEVVRLPAALGPGYAFCDLVAAADVVLSKPGYGIASECALNRTPLLGVERRGFREAPELSRGLREIGPFEEISLGDFFAGAWEPSIRRLLDAGRGWSSVQPDGARRVAERLKAHFGL